MQPDTAYLLSAAAVRERCARVLEAAERGATPHFRVVAERLGEAARLVADVTRRRYPDLDVPYHSRWRHFSAGGVERAAFVAPGADTAETARARIDLAIVSVLLDAGAGPDWRYREAESGQNFARSEGLAVASLRVMQRGLFSSDPENPWRADAAALMAVTPARLGEALQHEPHNPLAGLEGRAGLMRALGKAAAAQPGLFGAEGRLGRLYDHWLPHRAGLAAPLLLRDLLRAFGAIWPGRLAVDGVPLGDCWRHRAVPGDGLVPLHKLSQWLAYSLIEPLVAGGFAITEIDGLTGLGEYRNGGLLIDGGVLVPRDPGLARQRLDPAGEPVVEWRALTVALLDRLAPLVREKLGVDAASFPLASMLEGGSWAAGRELAFAKRRDGSPPLSIDTDGTLF
jgi:Protein of unknown function (DUF1688)